MNITSNNFYGNNIDITHKVNTTELHNWITHLKHIKIEIKLLEETLKDKILVAEILEKFKKKSFENNKLISVLNNYSAIRSNMSECEDMQCDMTYISEHEKYKKTYLYHLEKYNNLKKYL